MSVTDLHREGIDRMERYVGTADAEMMRTVAAGSTDDPTLALANGFHGMAQNVDVALLRRGLASLREPLLGTGTPLGDALAALPDEEHYVADRLRLPDVTERVVAIALGGWDEAQAGERLRNATAATDRARAALRSALEGAPEGVRPAADTGVA